MFHRNNKNKLGDLESLSELYRPSSRRFSVKLVPAFEGKGVSRGERNESSRALILVL
jgi:hypothetical protein